MIEALYAHDVVVDFRGERVTLCRPTVGDLVAALDAESRGQNMAAWYVANHVLNSDSMKRYTYEEVLKLSAPAVVALSRLIEPLYTEGLD